MSRQLIATLALAIAVALAGCSGSDTKSTPPPPPPPPPPTCSTGLADCGGTCVDLDTDGANCGGCGNACAAGRGCELGICEILCAAPAVRCGSGAAGLCADTSTDATHCGTCALACDTNEACRFGFCTTATCSAPLLPGPALSPAGARPVAFGAADFDGDQITDLAVAELTAAPAGRLVLMSGRGDGTFGAPVTIETLSAPSAVAVGDLDGDGKADLVVASSDPAITTLQPQLGDGAGGLITLVDSSLDAGPSPQAIALVDLNGDGRPDLVVGDGPIATASNLSVFLNDGLGKLGLPAGPGAPRTPNQVFDVGIDVRIVAGGDFNGDLLPDVVVASAGAGAPGGEVLIGGVTGALSRPVFNATPTNAFTLSATPTAIAVGDLDDDGYSDWVIAHADSNLLTLTLAATNGAPGTSWTLASVLEPRGVVIQDFNADGIPDLVTVNASANALYYHQGRGTVGGVYFDPPTPLPVGNRPVATALASASSTGAPYLFTLDEGGATVSAIESLTTGAFVAPSLYKGGAGPSAIALGTFNADAVLDAATTDASADQIEVRLGASGGTFGIASPVSLPAWSAPVALIAVDLDKDGKTDLVAALEGIGQLAVLWGDGLGGFSSPTLVGVGSSPEALLAADLDGDGILDLASADMGSDQVSIVYGQGSGGQSSRAFAAAVMLPMGKAPRGLAALDLDGAGCLDLVTADSGAGTLTVLHCNPAAARQYLAPAPSPACSGARALVKGDFDNDGRVDLAVSCADGVAVLRNPGTGALESPALHPTGGAPVSLDAADLDGDGWLDLIASVPGSGAVAVLFGAKDLAFSPPRLWAAGGAVGSTVAADVNGDGRLDLCASVELSFGALAGAGVLLMPGGCQP
jgi:hypothetical protein